MMIRARHAGRRGPVGARAAWPELGWEANPLTTASPQDQPARTPVLGATEGQEGTVAEVMMRAGRPVRAFVQDRGSAAAFALTTPHEMLRVLIACC